MFTLLKYVLLFACLSSALPIQQTHPQPSDDITSLQEVTESYVTETHSYSSQQSQYQYQQSSSDQQNSSGEERSHYYQHSSSGTAYLEGPTSNNQRGDPGKLDPSFIQELLPDVIVHNSALDTDPSTNPYNINPVQSDQAVDSDKNADKGLTAGKHTTNNGDEVKPPTAFHQDVYVDFEDIFKILQSNTDHTPGLDADTDSIDDQDDQSHDENENNNDHSPDLTDLRDRLHTYPHKDQFNAETVANIGTDSLHNVTNLPQGANVNLNDHNTKNNSQGVIVSTTARSISNGPLEPANLYPHLTSSDRNTNFGNVNGSYTAERYGPSVDHNRDIGTNNTSDPNNVTENPYYSINNNQDQSFNAGGNDGLTTQSSSQEETAILGITQQSALNSDNNNNLQQNSIQGENTQTADPRDLGIYTFEEETNRTQTTDTSIYIPLQERESTNSNSDLIVTRSQSVSVAITSSPTIRAAISENLDDNIDVTREIAGNFSQEGAINSTEAPSLIDLSNSGSGIGEVGDNNDVTNSLQYPEHLETTTITFLHNSDENNNNNKKQDSNQSNNEGINRSDTVTTSDHLTKLSTDSLGKGKGQKADISKSNDDLGEKKKTDKDYTDSRDTGIILGSTLTIAAVIILGIMITLCCACLRKNKGDKNTPGDNDDNSSEDSYGFTSASLRRGTDKPQQGDITGGEKGLNVDTYAIEPGVDTSSREHQIQLPVQPQKSSVLGFSLGSLTWKKKDKKKKERYNLNGNNADDDQLTVKDRIKALEGQASPHIEAKLAEESKPRKKKPKSKAFEDFESTGLIIGFGNNPRKNKATDQDNQYASEFQGFPDPDGDQIRPQREYGSRDQINEEEGLGSMGSMEYRMPCLSKSQESDRSISLSSGSKLTEDEGIHTMDSEDDELGNAVPRQTEILKSFRRAPPPRNRNRARRSFQKRGQQREDISLGGLEVQEEDENEDQTDSGIRNSGNSKDNSKPDKDNSKPSVVNFRGSTNKLSDNDNIKRGFYNQQSAALSVRPVTSIGASTGEVNNISSHRLSFNGSNNGDNIKSDENRKRYSNFDSGFLSSGYKAGNKEREEKKDTASSDNWKSPYNYDSSPVWKSRSVGDNKRQSNDQIEPADSSIVWKSTKDHENSPTGLKREGAPSWINRNYDLVKARNEKTPSASQKTYDLPQRKIGSTSYLNRNSSTMEEYKNQGVTPQSANTSTSNTTKISTMSWTPNSTGKVSGKSQTPPRSFAQQKLMKDESNNNGSPRNSFTSGSRPGSQHIENNNMYKSGLSMTNTDNNNTNKNSAKYSAFEAEATFSDQGGNYSFYTPNPLEQDSDEDNNKTDVDNSSQYNKQLRKNRSSSGADKDNTSDSKHQSNVNSSCDNIKRDSSHGAGNKNSSIKDKSGMPLSGLGQSSEVTYKPSYTKGSVEKTAYSSNKKQYSNKNIPNYENIAFSPTTPPTPNELQQQQEHVLFHSTPAYRTQSSYPMSQTPATTRTPSLPGRYNAQGIESGAQRTGYGIARHDPTLPYSDTVVPTIPSATERLTSEADNDDVFYTDIRRHDSGYYSRQQSHISNFPSNSSHSYRQSSNMNEFSPAFPRNTSGLVNSPNESSIHSNLPSPMDTSYYNSLSNVQSPISPVSPTGSDIGSAGFNIKTLSQGKRSMSQNESFHKSNSIRTPRQMSSDQETGTRRRNFYLSQDSIDGDSQSQHNRSSTGSLLKFNTDFEGTTV